MASEYAIANVGETLVDLLVEEMSSDYDDKEVVLASPNVVKDNDTVRLTLYLYDVSHNAHLRNEEPPAPSTAETRPDHPLRLDLQYLLTAYPSTGTGGETANTVDQHEVLGEAMQVLHDNPLLAGSDLGDPFDADEAVSISVVPESMDTVVSIWNTFAERPYRPSVAYLATPVVLESTREEDVSRVTDRELTSHLPGPAEDDR